MVFDGHSDLLYDVTRRRLAGETRVLERRHLDRLRRGGIEGLVLSFWYGLGGGQTFWEGVPGKERAAYRLEIMLSCAQAEFAECPWLAVVRTPGEAEAAKAQGKIYAFLGLEGMEGLEGPEDLEPLAALGLRLGMLTWNEENRFAAGAAQDPAKGLTGLGRQALRRMEDLGMLADLSHLNDGGFRDVIRLARGPVLASHSNCRALCPHPRNLTDEQLRAIRDSGGVVGLNVHHKFVHEDPAKQTAKTLALHAAHMAEVMGVEHVACGFDFCEFMGPGNDAAAGLEDCGQTSRLFDWLERLGMTAAEREQIARGNFLRILDKAKK
ncbi:membrane dipeptidase [uncultured Oscillibacter sp.]|uniref:dipeptidase n=1 Tax=uncultured Oscillibacter sp. TaxID=876091 RepID=UPI0025DA5970|nr:membrane dipeptidase [uncultured Oscillibacter sp.]